MLLKRVYVIIRNEFVLTVMHPAHKNMLMYFINTLAGN